MIRHGLPEPPVELLRFNPQLALAMYLKRQIVKLGDILTGDGTGKYQGRPGHEIEIGGDLRADLIVGESILFGAIPFADYQYQSPARLLDDSGDLLVQLDVQFAGVHQQ